jgi:lysophospholipase L1-like esterase
MEFKKIAISFFYFALPALFLSALVLLLCACTKTNIHTTPAITPINTINTDSMPDLNAKKYLALGDSYTIGTSVDETDRYPVQTVALLKSQGIDIAAAQIIATNGWTTADLINGINKTTLASNYDAVSLLIGVNNQYQGRMLDEYQQQFTTLVQRSIELANGKPDHVFIISIPDYSVTPFAANSDTQKIAMEIDAFNNANRAIASAYKVEYLYITDDSRKAAGDPSLIASDGLHFSGKEYAIWSAKLAALMKPTLQ